MVTHDEVNHNIMIITSNTSLSLSFTNLTYFVLLTKMYTNSIKISSWKFREDTTKKEKIEH